MEKKFSIWPYLICFSLGGYGQNLIPNPSFESGQYDECEPIIDARAYGNVATEWSCPSGGTSDVFTTQIPNKACFSSMPYAGIDRNVEQLHVGSQSPRTGNRFAGVITYGSASDPEYREYIQASLSEPLAVGNYYCAEMYVSLAEYNKFASGGLGMYFGEDLVNVYPNWEALPYTPQISANGIVLDSVNWIKISGAFKATTSAKYIIIGNFSDDDHTTTVDIHGRFEHFEDYDIAYYFIDDVSVEAIATPVISTSGEQLICQGQYAQLYAEGNFETLEWSTLDDPTTVLRTSKTISVNPLKTTRYLAKGYVCQLQITDTITVEVVPFARPDLGKDTSLCEGATLRLQTKEKYRSYLWSANSTAPYLDVSHPGKYSVSVESDDGCRGEAKVLVSGKSGPRVDLGNDTLICKEPLLLSAGQGLPEYHWSTGAMEPSITVVESGSYWVVVANACGQDRDTIRIDSHRDLFIPNVITLNEDGLNDRFEITGLNSSYHGSLRIFDRLGDTVYSVTEYQNEWPEATDPPATGVYYYSLDYPGCATYKGWIQVLK